MLPMIPIGPAVIPSNAVAFILALWLGAAVAERACKTRELDANQVWNVIGIGVLVMFVAARAIYVLQNFAAYAAEPLQMVALNPNALAVEYGAVFGIIAVAAYIQQRKIPFASFADALTPGVLVAFAIFAVGQFLSGDGFGTPTTLFWGINLYGDVRHPTPIYVAVLAALGAYATWQMARAQMLPVGATALNGIAWYAFVRVFVDAFLADATFWPGGYRASQVIALIVLLIALSLRARIELRAIK